VDKSFVDKFRGHKFRGQTDLALRGSTLELNDFIVSQ
jgi:hypothetical protein